MVGNQTEKIGTVILADENERPIFTVFYNAMRFERNRTLATPEGLFEAVRQTDDGTWVYRWFAPIGSVDVNPFLRDYTEV